MQPKGFTLIETILYLGLAAAILLAVSILLTTVMEIRVKSQVIAEVEEQGLQALETITRSIRNSQTVVNPLPGAGGQSLTLGVVDPEDEPTVFELAENSIMMRQGAKAGVPLTGTRLVATDLLFENLSRPDTPNIIRISFILAYHNPENKSAYEYSQKFITSAAIR